MPALIPLLTAEKKKEPLPLRAVALAGTLAALTAAFLVCRIPHATPQSLSFFALLRLSVKYMAITLAWGVAATWIYFRRSTTRPVADFLSLARSLFFAWILFPPLVLFLFEESPGLLIVAPAATVALSMCLQGYLTTQIHSPAGTLANGEEGALFAGLPPPAPGRLAAWLSSLCIYAAAIAAINGAIVKASVFLSICAFLFMSRWAVMVTEPTDEETRRKPSLTRTAAAAVAAILVTWIALIPWLRISHAPIGVYASRSAKAVPPKSANAAIAAADPWHAILLWPFPPRKERLEAPVLSSSHSATRAVPVVIPFDGEYRYYETPGLWIPNRAHAAKGSPLDVNIHSADWGPLLMEAHQQLSAPVDLSSCREIQVSLRNGDNRRGRILIGLILTDTASTGQPSVILEPQPVLSSEPLHADLKDKAAEVLSFTIPPHAKIHNMDEITILFLPDPERAALGSKIAIQGFTLMPR
jgi:hypothetical protein